MTSISAQLLGDPFNHWCGMFGILPATKHFATQFENLDNYAESVVAIILGMPRYPHRRGPRKFIVPFCGNLLSAPDRGDDGCGSVCVCACARFLRSATDHHAHKRIVFNGDSIELVRTQTRTRSICLNISTTPDDRLPTHYPPTNQHKKKGSINCECVFRVCARDVGTQTIVIHTF